MKISLSVHETDCTPVWTLAKLSTSAKKELSEIKRNFIRDNLKGISNANTKKEASLADIYYFLDPEIILGNSCKCYFPLKYGNECNHGHFPLKLPHRC